MLFGQLKRKTFLSTMTASKDTDADGQWFRVQDIGLQIFNGFGAVFSGIRIRGIFYRIWKLNATGWGLGVLQFLV